MIKIEQKDALYPSVLKSIKKSPKQLYLEGNTKLLETPAIAIIGSRTCTSYGEKMAEKFAQELSQYGLTIISGMAKGIDSIAHKASLEVKGNTIAVLPCGLNKIYPKKNIGLYKRIIENDGLVLTEYEPDLEASSEKFLERNIIINTLSIGILVIEGGHRSGTSFTAHNAMKADKKVFCIPSSLENPKGITPNKLIQEGAMLVTNVEDIICEYKELNLKKHITSKTELINELESDEDNEVLKILRKETHINEIAKKLKLSISETNSKLMLLELEDKVIALPGNYYKRKT